VGGLRALGAVLALVLATGASPARADGPVVDHVRVASFDGTTLDGWVVRPAGGGRRPVVLWSAPYFGECSLNLSWSAPGERTCTYGTGDDPELWDNDVKSEAVPVDVLVEHGYAVAIFNVRGTGGSGGCLSWYGPDEQRDQAHLVEWLAAQDFSTGDVATMGLSYHAGTAMAAAVQAPRHLRTVVVAGLVTDPRLLSFSPQGATNGAMMYDLWAESFGLSFGVDPAPERLCPDLARFMTHAKAGGFAGLRDEAFWRARALVDRFEEIRAPVLVAHGLGDDGHAFQLNGVWRALRGVPKRFFLGQQQHEFPNFNTLRPELARADWNGRLLAWLDRHLRGRKGGRWAKTGVAEYVDSAGALHRTRRWPPSARGWEVPLAAGSFRSVPPLDKLANPAALPCEANALVTETPPVTEDTLIAGEPRADLLLASDLGGGQISVDVFDAPPGPACGGGVRHLALGAADLRFRHGGSAPSPFPIGVTAPVRIDLWSLAHVLPAGHRLVVVVSFGDPARYETWPHVAATLTIHPASRVVLPVAG
jgi:hypothetical protein